MIKTFVLIMMLFYTPNMGGTSVTSTMSVAEFNSEKACRTAVVKLMEAVKATKPSVESIATCVAK